MAADVYDPAALAQAFAGHDAAVSLLTRIPSVRRAAPLAPSGPPATALDAERHAGRFGGTAVVLRFGLFLGRDSEQTQALLAQARLGSSPWLVRQAGFLPTVWLDDAGRAVAAATTTAALPAGAYNVVDDEPVRRAEADAALAAVVGRRRLRAPLAGDRRLAARRRLNVNPGWVRWRERWTRWSRGASASALARKCAVDPPLAAA